MARRGPPVVIACLPFLALLAARPALCEPFFFGTGSPDGRMAAASRPASTGLVETEAADDFVLAGPTSLTGGTFTGILTGDASLAGVGQVRVEFYQVFPLDSADPPSGLVPTRTGSPSDTPFAERDAVAGSLSFATSLLSPSFAAVNSVVNGIGPKPSQTTGGEGPVAGLEVVFGVSFDPVSLPAGHYFFVPEVQVGDGSFLWLSAPRPSTASGTPFTPDLESWIRNGSLAPDWLRIGTDVVGGEPAPTFNGTFTLIGEEVPEPSTALLVGTGLLLLVRRPPRDASEEDSLR